jgi:hypothetical protein
MNMIWHAVYSQHFLSFILNDACDVFVEFFFPVWMNKSLPILNRKDDLNIDLRIRICHFIYDFNGFNPEGIVGL